MALQDRLSRLSKRSALLFLSAALLISCGQNVYPIKGTYTPPGKTAVPLSKQKAWQAIEAYLAKNNLQVEIEDYDAGNLIVYPVFLTWSFEDPKKGNLLDASASTVVSIKINPNEVAQIIYAPKSDITSSVYKPDAVAGKMVIHVDEGGNDQSYVRIELQNLRAIQMIRTGPAVAFTNMDKSILSYSTGQFENAIINSLK